MLSKSQVECKSPPYVEPGIVPLSITYEGDGEKFQSEAVDYLYYETPIAESIDTTCGPTYGYTQITVKGQHFIDMGFGKAKCVFNDTQLMNATIINEHTIKCSTPKLTEDQAGLAPQHMFFFVAVTLNGIEHTQEAIKFRYYPDPRIEAVKHSPVGPVSGGTISQLTGRGFTHPNVCNLKVRYGALETTPIVVKNDTYIETKSP